MKKYIILLVSTLVLLFSCALKEVPVSSISLSQSLAEMIIGETLQLTATISPSDATEQAIAWTSSNQSVATVSNSGLVTALSEGSSIITASAGGKSTVCNVSVSKGYVAVTSITLNKTELSLKKGQTETLVAIVSPDDATEPTVTWSSSDNKVATVDQNGKVNAISLGSTQITAKAGDKTAICNVSVEPIIATSVKIIIEKLTMDLKETQALSYELSPEDCESVEMNWSSSDESILSVDADGLCTAISEGIVTVTVSNDDMSLKDTVEIKVVDPFMKVGMAYVSKWGFECTVKSISVNTVESKMTCSISYTIKNITTDIKLSECTFYCTTQSGGGASQYGFFGYVYPNESVSRSYTFDTITSDPFLKLVFQNSFGNEIVNPDAPTLQWDLTGYYNQ